MALTTYGTAVDLRPLAPRERQPLVFNTLRSLGSGESLDLVDDQDPRPLREQLASEAPGRFAWNETQSGPEVWRVRIVKLAGHREGGCCGACGGGL